MVRFMRIMVSFDNGLSQRADEDHEEGDEYLVYLNGNETGQFVGRPLGSRRGEITDQFEQQGIRRPPHPYRRGAF